MGKLLFSFGYTLIPCHSFYNYSNVVNDDCILYRDNRTVWCKALKNQLCFQLGLNFIFKGCKADITKKVSFMN